MPQHRADDIKKAVRERYGRRARRVGTSGSLATAATCCGPSSASLTYAEGLYSKEELAGLPDTAVEVVSGCGNPAALAGLKPGEVVLDLGSGGGIDCLLAARQVGPQGKVIGVDMTPQMIALAQRNAAKLGMSNVEFRLGELENLPVDNNSIDVVISNCVICLTPEKDVVFREAFRVLRPGGRLCISDEVSEVELPREIRGDLSHWVRCAAGALERNDYLRRLRQAGFQVVSTLERRHTASGPGDWMGNLTSLSVTAVKPSSG